MRTAGIGWVPPAAAQRVTSTSSSFVTPMSSCRRMRRRAQASSYIFMTEQSPTGSDAYKQFAEMLDMRSPDQSDVFPKSKAAEESSEEENAEAEIEDDYAIFADMIDVDRSKTQSKIERKVIPKAEPKTVNIDPADYALFDNLLKKSGGSGKKALKGSKAFLNSAVAKKALKSDGKLSKKGEDMRDLLRAIAPKTVPPREVKRSGASPEETASAYEQMMNEFGQSMRSDRMTSPISFKPQENDKTGSYTEPTVLNKPPRRPGFIQEEETNSDNLKRNEFGQNRKGSIDMHVPWAEMDRPGEPAALLQPPQRPKIPKQSTKNHIDAEQTASESQQIPTADTSDLSPQETADAYELMANEFKKGTSEKVEKLELVEDSGVSISEEERVQEVVLLQPPVKPKVEGNVEQSKVGGEQPAVEERPSKGVELSQLSSEETEESYDFMENKFGRSIYDRGEEARPLMETGTQSSVGEMGSKTEVTQPPAVLATPPSRPKFEVETEKGIVHDGNNEESRPSVDAETLSSSVNTKLQNAVLAQPPSRGSYSAGNQEVTAVKVQHDLNEEKAAEAESLNTKPTRQIGETTNMATSETEVVTKTERLEDDVENAPMISDDFGQHEEYSGFVEAAIDKSDSSDNAAAKFSADEEMFLSDSTPSVGQDISLSGAPSRTSKSFDPESYRANAAVKVSRRQKRREQDMEKALKLRHPQFLYTLE